LDAGTVQCTLRFSSVGAILLAQSFNGATLASSAPGVVTPNTWYELAIQVTIGSAGSIAVYVNQPKVGGVATLLAAGINTRQTANSYMNAFWIGDLSNAFAGLQIDDFHAFDTTGSAPNAILGAGTRIYTKMSTGPGALSTWTPVGSSPNWDCVNEAPPDDDATYVMAASSLEDNYGVGAAALGGSNTVNGIVRISRVRMDDAGPHTFQNGLRSGSVDQLGPAGAVASGYGYIDSGCSIIDPNTGAAWSVAAADLATPIIYRTT
jgi:hypothetical protein